MIQVLRQGSETVLIQQKLTYYKYYDPLMEIFSRNKDMSLMPLENGTLDFARRNIFLQVEDLIPTMATGEEWRIT